MKLWNKGFEMRSVSLAKETTELSSGCGNRDGTERTSTFRRKRTGTVIRKRNEDQVPNVDQRGKGVRMKLRQMVVGEIPKEKMKIA